MTEMIVLNVEEMLQVRGIKWKPPMSGEVALEIVLRWNRGLNSRQIAAEMGLPSSATVGRTIAVVRGRITGFPLRKADAPKQHGGGQPEAASWWTQERMDIARRLFTETDMHVDGIAARLDTTTSAIWTKIKHARWTRPRMSPARRSNPSGSNLAKALEGKSKATNLVHYDAVEGSQPVEFWKVGDGRCRFVLEDKPGNMSEALCCNREIAAGAPRGHAYCPDHPGGAKNGFEDPLAAGRRIAGPKDLERLARNFG